MAKYDGVFEGRLPRALMEYASRVKASHVRRVCLGHPATWSGLLVMMKKWLVDTDKH